MEKVVLKDGTELLSKDLPQPFLMNFRNDFPENLDQYKLYLESYPNEAGKTEISDLRRKKTEFSGRSL